MLIKNLTIDEKSKYRIKQLVEYVLLDNNPEKNPFEDFVILQNIHTIDPKKIHKEFLAQDKYRKKRENGICYHHTLMSFNPKDSPFLTNDILEDLAKQYIKIRGIEDALVLAKHHQEKDHLHVHFLISATRYKSSKSIRINNQDYYQVRRDIETYQVEHYPQLKSIVYLDKPRKQSRKKDSDRVQSKRNEFQMKARLQGKEPTKKEILNQRVSEILAQSKSPKEFLLTLKSEPDFELYQYRGKITGIIYQNKKYRFTTFGIAKEELQKLRETHQRMRSIRKNLGQTKGLNRGS